VAVFDDDVSADDEAGLFERLEKRFPERGFRRGRPITEISNDRLLRTRRERPSCHGAANYCDEIAPLHARPETSE
jgi:hypothetical protein